MSRLSFAVSQAAPNASDALSPFSKAPVAIIFICISPPSRVPSGDCDHRPVTILVLSCPGARWPGQLRLRSAGPQESEPRLHEVGSSDFACGRSRVIRSPSSFLAIEPLSLSCRLLVTRCRRRSHAPPNNQSAQKAICEIRIFPHGPVCRSLKIRNGTDPQQETIPSSRRSGVAMSPYWKGGVRAPC